MENNLTYEKVLRTLVNNHNIFSDEKNKILISTTSSDIIVEFIGKNKIIKEYDTIVDDKLWKCMLQSIFNLLIKPKL